jgi:hypothetical protein
MFSRGMSLTAGFRNNVVRHSPVTPLLEGNEYLKPLRASTATLWQAQWLMGASVLI